LKNLQFILLFSACLFTHLAFSQESSETSSEGERGFYRREISGGAFLHTNGVGGNFRYALRKTGYRKTIFAGEISTMKHPKEIKVTSSNFDNTRGFVYGKQNSLTILRTQYGFQKIWFTKDRKKGVQVSYFLLGGQSIGFEKPVYLEIRPDDRTTRTLRTEVFDPSRHNSGNIIGRAPVLTGLEETKLVPGLNLKLGLNFEYAPYDDMLRAIEVGVNVDGFVRNINIQEDIQGLDSLQTLIIAKPQQEFSEKEKYHIDQFVMNGGRILWLIDPVFASMDSLQMQAETIGMAWPLNLDDMLFRYGARLNPDLVTAMQSVPIPITTGYMGNRPQISLKCKVKVKKTPSVFCRRPNRLKRLGRVR